VVCHWPSFWATANRALSSTENGRAPNDPLDATTQIGSNASGGTTSTSDTTEERGGATISRAAKAAFVHELVRWSGLDQLPSGRPQCWIVGLWLSAAVPGSSAGITAFEVLGSVQPTAESPGQAQLTGRRPALPFRGDGCPAPSISPMVSSMRSEVWRPDAHMADKQRYAMSCWRVLAAGKACWRGPDWKPARSKQRRADEPASRWWMRQLLDQWAHPEVRQQSSLFRHNLACQPFANGARDHRRTGTKATLPSGSTRSWKGIRRPGAVLGPWGPNGRGCRDSRETPTRCC